MTYHPEAQSKGRLARLDGLPASECPYSLALDKHMFLSWMAGWQEVHDDPNAPKDKPDPATCSWRSGAFFMSDVSEATDYVLGQASMYRDKASFVDAVINSLKLRVDESKNAELKGGKQ